MLSATNFTTKLRNAQPCTLMIFLYSVIGFGLTNHRKRDPANHLQELVVRELNNQDCQQYILSGIDTLERSDLLRPLLKKSMRYFNIEALKNFEISQQKSICLPQGTKKNSAAGDSGGPLLLQVSWST